MIQKYKIYPYRLNISFKVCFLTIFFQSLKRISKDCTSGFPGCLVGKESACNAVDPGSLPGSGRSPGKGNATYSIIPAWETPWTEEHVGPQSMGSQRVRHDWTTNTHTNKGCISKPNSLGWGFPMKISYENMEIPLLNVDLKQMGLLMCCVKFLKAWSVSRFSCVQLLVTPWTVACQLLCPWNYLGESTGVGSHSLL